MESIKPSALLVTSYAQNISHLTLRPAQKFHNTGTNCVSSKGIKFEECDLSPRTLP